MSSLLNKSEVRKYILDTWQATRSWPLTRVSSAAVEEIEGRLKHLIDSMIQTHPSVGKTFSL